MMLCFMMMTGPKGTRAQQPVKSRLGIESLEVWIRESFVGFGDHVLDDLGLGPAHKLRGPSKWWIGLLWDFVLRKTANSKVRL